MPGNTSLHKAKKAKNDEFYTQYSDIEREMNAYLEYNPDVFKGKIILLPCDDPEWSNFTKYFAQNFERFGIKKLISTSFAADSKQDGVPYQPSLFELNDPKFDEKKTRARGKIFILEKDSNKSGKIDINDLEWDYLKGDGDFKSEEIKKIRDESDMIITNPPFSLFREFLGWIMESGKSFSIIGGMNAITYKEVFPLIKNNTIWLGNGFNHGNAYFRPASVERNYANGVYDDNTNLVKFRNCVWYTNIDHGRRHQPLALMTMEDNLKFSKHKIIREKGYLKYDNYDAIEVPFTDAIPSDYKEGMGVPISFLEKYNPDEFQIEKFRKGDDGKDLAYTDLASKQASKQADYSVLQNHHQKEGCVAELWASQSHSLKSSALSNSLLSGSTAQTVADGTAKARQSTEKISTGESLLNIRCNGIMGVPISFLDKYSPEQFDIIGATESEGKGFSDGIWNPESSVAQPLINNKRVYKRIFIKYKESK